MKITLLGTGTPEPSLKRQSSGYALRVNGQVILFDGGPGSYHNLLKSGLKPTSVSRVFFTHFHYDHCIEYPRIVLQRWDMGAGRIPDLDVYGPTPLAAITEKLFGVDGAFSHDLNARTENAASLFVFQERGGVLPRRKPAPRIHEIVPGDVIEGDGWKVSVGEARHFQPQLECYGYRIDTPAGALCYAGDSGGNCQDIIDLARGADVLIHMVQHETNAAPSPEFRLCNGTHLDIAKLAAEAGVKTLVVTHIGSAIDRPGTRERVLAEMAREFSGRIIWGEDLMTIDVASGEVCDP